jgi:hypothetical protein
LYVLSALCFQEFVNIAWDSAGVTTGPVTVPLVLSLGSGFSIATHASNGFGLLTLASIGPILSVLIFGNMLNAIGSSNKSPTYGRQRVGSKGSAAPSALDGDDFEEDEFGHGHSSPTPDEFNKWSKEADDDFGHQQVSWRIPFRCTFVLHEIVLCIFEPNHPPKPFRFFNRTTDSLKRVVSALFLRICSVNENLDASAAAHPLVLSQVDSLGSENVHARK